MNLAALVPVVAYFFWRRKPAPITARQLIILGVFAMAFGFLEATVVAYLRAAAGLLPGYRGTLSDVIQLSHQPQATAEIPASLLTLEVLREAATLIMLSCAALLVSPKPRVCAAAFLWTFAIWDIVYYASLWATIRWPHSMGDPDVLFLIPEPWFAPVWFPVLVSALALAAVLLTRSRAEDVTN